MGTSKKTTEQFIDEAKLIHGDKYDYSKVEYKNQLTKVCIICREHGEFWQMPKQHLRGQGCPKCGLTKNKVHNNVKYKRQKGKAYSNEEFVEKLKLIYGNSYDYSKVNYVNINSKITLICPEHGEFTKTANSLINKKKGCPLCNRKNNADKLKIGKEKFIERSNEIFHNVYDYSSVEYINNFTKVKIRCKKHGIFLCTPQNHLHGRGCPICKSEHYVYEERLNNFLKTFLNESDIVRQYKAEWLTNNKTLDFYIPKFKIAIEHQGSQHYFLTRYDGDNEEKLNKRIKNDEDKFNECKENDVKLLYFTYELSKTPSNCSHELIFEEDKLKNKILNLINKQNE